MGSVGFHDAMSYSLSLLVLFYKRSISGVVPRVRKNWSKRLGTVSGRRLLRSLASNILKT